MEHGFQGQDGQEVPEMSDAFVASVTDRYIELYESITGEKFVRQPLDNVTADIEAAVNKVVRSL